MDLNLIQKICIWSLPILFALTLHEAAHAYVAKRFGDSTAALAGRVSLNPIRHIDPLGTLLIPLVCMLSGASFLFGWARPTPVDARNLRNPQRDLFWVFAAGPASHLVMAIGWALVWKLAIVLPNFSLQVPMMLMGQAGIGFNLMLLVLNLVPLPPMDGGRMLLLVLPPAKADQLQRAEPYLNGLLILLLITGVLAKVLLPIVGVLYQLLYTLIL
ncbi:site-2 protease family protein [Amantichitinum ursilacus]|uniref:Peptidase family M50 n=1 Tax=Amantichitinum ursilacus TaxID=857265 RepID=A0A0N0XH34_9NEIS|nr:site-2 protease family protein [Amantichitinum ursilacus]KPC50515.1 Peptidase family M50 [Amantichitinum ursilacus]